MLQNIRDRTQGWITWIIISLISLTFVLWGVQSYIVGSGPSEVAALVGDVNITHHQLNTTYERLRQQQQMQLGQNFTLTPAIEKQLKQEALQQLISSQVLSEGALAQGYRFTEQQGIEAIKTTSTFQVNGQFSPGRFNEVLNSIQYSEAMFLKELRAAMLINQPRTGLLDSAFALPNEVDTIARLAHQTRDIRYLTIRVASFLKDAQVSEESILSYYKTNQAQFKTPEQVSIEYIELSASGDQGDALANLTYANPESLETAAKTLSLPIKQTGLFSRNGEKTGLLSNANIIKAAFSDEVLKQKMNSAVIELDANRLIVLRIKQYHPSAVQPFETVKKTILEKLKANTAQTKAEELGKTILASLKSQQNIDALLKKNQLSWTTKKAVDRYDTKISTSILNQAFSLPQPTKNTAFPSSSFSASSEDVVVLQLLGVQAGDSSQLTPAERTLLSDQIARAYGELDYDLYTRVLMDRAKVKIN